MQYWVAYNHCVICLCARGGWSEIPLYNNITPRSQTLSTLFGNEKLPDSSVNVKPLLLGDEDRIESVMFGAQFLHLDVVIIMFVCGFVWSDFAHLSLVFLTSVKTSLMWLVKFWSITVFESFECWTGCVLTCFRHVCFWWFYSLE